MAWPPTQLCQRTGEPRPWEDERSLQTPGLVAIAESRSEMEMRACQNPLLLIHTSEITTVHVPPWRKLCGLQNCCWIF